MKIAIPAKGPETESMIDSRFGRAPVFVIYDSEEKSISCVENVQNLNATQGAGLQSAKHVIDSGATVVIAAHCGPKAFTLLSQFDVCVYKAEDMSCETAIEMFENGTLPKMTSADVEGHWV